MKKRCGLAPRALAGIVLATATAVGGVAESQPQGATRLPIEAALADENGDFVPDLLGHSISVEGVLTTEPRTGAQGQTLFTLQDDTAGLALLSAGPSRLPGRLRAGDRVRATGTLGQFRGAERLNVQRLDRLGAGNVPRPRDVLATDVTSERYSGQLVRLVGELVVPPDVSPESPPLLQDRSGRVRVHLAPHFFSDARLTQRLAEGGQLEVVGIASQVQQAPPFNRGYGVFLRDVADLQFAPQPAHRALLPYAAVGVIFAVFVYLWQRRISAERRAGEMAKLSEGLERSQAALRESEAYLRAMFDSARLGVARVDLDGGYLEGNRAVQEMLGYSDTELRGRRFDALAPAEDAEFDRAQFRELARGRRDHYEIETRSVRKDGTTVWLQVTSSAIRGEDGEPQFVLRIVEDITERRLLEEQLRQSQKMEAIGQLAGGVAHDFNNMLAVINGYTQLLLLRGDLCETTRAPLEEMHRAGDRAASLTRQLLAFSRKQVLAPRLLDLNEVVGNLEKMLRRLIGEDVRLETALDQDLGRVEADPGQVEQVIMNLAVNARDAMPRGGQLTIETRNVTLDESYTRHHLDARPGDYVMIAVSDTGCGMDRDTLSRIFEPFFTTKRLGEGTGLGLATVYGIVKQSGGHVGVYSEPGRGTSFKVYLPRLRSGIDYPGAEEQQPKPPAGWETILLVEDEPMVRNMVAHVLRMSGYTLLEASGGEEATRICEEHAGPIHLLVTDVVMPSTSGRELAERISQKRPQIQVLYTSGYTDDAVVRHGVLADQVAFLQKPFTPLSLAQKVRGVLDQVPRRRAALALTEPPVLVGANGR